MRGGFEVRFLVLCAVVSWATAGLGTDDARETLDGVWVAESIEADGKAAPAEDVKRMRWTFRKDKLTIRGNHKNDREDECTYSLDTKQSPMHLDFTPAKEKKAILAIYEVKDDKLKICARHASSQEKRPTDFSTKADSDLVLIVLKKEQK